MDKTGNTSKRIFCLKNNKTGDFKAVDESIMDFDNHYFVEVDVTTRYPKSDYSKATCLLIEESELRQLIQRAYTDGYLSLIEPGEDMEGKQIAKEIEETQTRLLNSLTKT